MLQLKQTKLSSFHCAVAMCMCAFSSGALCKDTDNYFYDDDPSSVVSIISDFAQKLCTVAFAGTGYSARKSCDTSRTCKVELEINDPHPAGDVYLTADFHLLFSRSDVGNKQTIVNTPTQHFTVGGSTLTIRRKIVPLISDDGQLKEMSACFNKVGTILREKLDKENNSSLGLSSDSSRKGIARIEERLPQISHGTLAIFLPKAVDIREDAIFILEFTPTQRFSFAESVSDPDLARLLKNLDELTGTSEKQIKAILDHLSEEIQGGTRPNSVGQLYVTGGLAPAPSKFTSLSVSLEEPDAQVIPLTPSRQKLTPLVPSRWLWKVRFSGKDDVATLRISISDPSQDTNIRDLYFNAIDVKVEKPWDFRMQKFFGTYWQWVTATFVMPLLLYGWRRRLESSKEKYVHVPFRHRIRK